MKNRYTVLGVNSLKSKPIVTSREEFLNHLGLIKNAAKRDVHQMILPVKTEMENIRRENIRLQEELVWLRLQVQRLRDYVKHED